MSQLQGKDRSRYVQETFGRVAGRYNLMNHMMTAGQDVSWVRYLVRQLDLNPRDRVLDLATGTGDIAFEVLRTQPQVGVTGADFAPVMMTQGRLRPGGDRVDWVGADALHLPFADASFDVVTQGYLLRNLAEIPPALAEQFRVLRPGGRVTVLDSSPPPHNLLRPFILAYLRWGIPLLGQLVNHDRTAYAYLTSSTAQFKTPAELAALLTQAGFVNVHFASFMFGTVAIHWADKPL